MVVSLFWDGCRLPTPERVFQWLPSYLLASILIVLLNSMNLIMKLGVHYLIYVRMVGKFKEIKDQSQIWKLCMELSSIYFIKYMYPSLILIC